MAVFESDAKRKPGTRSNTKLFISGGDAPAEHWILDESLPILFNYEYGGPAQKEVVISKGMAVGIKPNPELDYETNKYKGVLTFASDANPVVGLAPYNFTKQYRDFLTGNQPSIVTREYIELPYIPNADDAALVKWGAVHGAGIKNGDLVTYSRDANNPGKLIKWVEGTHSITTILGQVLATEIDQEPWGWLKWAMFEEAAKAQDQGPINKSGYAAPGESGYPFDPGYREGTYDKDGYQTPWVTNPTGIPGILDGSQKAQTPQTKSFVVGANATAGTKYVVDLGLKNIVEGTVNLFDGAAAPVAASAFVVDYKNGQLTFTLPGNNDASADTYVIQFRANFFGTPAGWDYKGATGAIRILLNR